MAVDVCQDCRRNGRRDGVIPVTYGARPVRVLCIAAYTEAAVVGPQQLYSFAT